MKSDEYVLGSWAGEPFVSPKADELKLQRFVRLLDYMFDRCSETVAGTPQRLRCWLHSYTQHRYFLKPFILP